MSEVAISVKGIKKSFRLPHESHSGIKQLIVGVFRKNKKRGYETQHVLKGLSFDIEKGDFFGIVGRNGSGKSTLLKLLAGIYTPDAGRIEVNGSIVPFIELGVGFNPELTGRENIYMNGALLGFSHAEMSAMYDEIVEFAELERFMDQKLKNYSSGMQVRLAFSIAIKAQGDILILDEVLAVGDEAFQRKCNLFFDEIKKDKSKTVILVTHSMDSVRKYCNKAMLIQEGEISVNGHPDKVADEYYGLNLQNNKSKSQNLGSSAELHAKITSKRVLGPKDSLTMEISYTMMDKRPVVAKAYLDFNGQIVMIANPVLLGDRSMITRDTIEHKVLYTLPLGDFNSGEYRVITLLEDLDSNANIASFGYEEDTIIKIKNPNKSSSVGILVNKARLEFFD